MKLEIKKFGTYLISRPEGRDAFLVIKNQFIPLNTLDNIQLDFAGVEVMTPSWLDEVVTGLAQVYGKSHIQYLNTLNASVKMSLETVLESLDD